jgi:hypothetical protein
MTPQYLFGPGVGWCTPLTDFQGNAAANPTPFLIAGMQDISLDLSADLKELYGGNAVAVAIGRGKQKFSVKIKNAQVNGRLWNTLYFGQIGNQSAGIYDAVIDQTGSVIPATPFTVTPAPPASGTWGYNLGVRDSNNNAYARVASAPTTGQYSVASGVYTFAPADTGKLVYIDYNYTATSTVAQKLRLANPLMGQAPSFQFDLKLPYAGNVFNATLFSCVATKFGLQTKLDDFTYPEFDFSAQAPGGADIGELSWSQ